MYLLLFKVLYIYIYIYIYIYGAFNNESSYDEISAKKLYFFFFINSIFIVLMNQNERYSKSIKTKAVFTKTEMNSE